MALAQTLKTLLAKHKIRYTTRKHPVAYTAQEIAAAEHIPGKQLAKCVLLKTNKGFFLAVLPAIYLVDLAKLKTLLRATKVGLASESDIKQAFPDVEVGAMPPFGNLYNVPTVVDKRLAESEQMVCNAGTHAETLTVRYRDFERLVKPKLGLFGVHVSLSGRAKPKKAATRRKTARSRKRSSGRT